MSVLLAIFACQTWIAEADVRFYMIKRMHLKKQRAAGGRVGRVLWVPQDCLGLERAKCEQNMKQNIANHRATLKGNPAGGRQNYNKKCAAEA